jgi:YidC/Oxa1 family membrane protein insertase
MENKNLLIAILLSVGFLFFWSVFVMPKYAPHSPQTNPDTLKPAAQLPAGPKTLAAGHANPLPTETATELIWRDDRHEIVFSPNGGGIRHWQLKLKGQEIDLVEDPDSQPLPLATWPDSLFSIQQHQNQIILQGKSPEGLRVSKEITINPEGYLNDVVFRLENPSGKPVDVKDWSWGWGPGLGTAPTEKKENNRLIRALSMGKLKAHVLKPGEYSEFGSWAGIDNRYFLVAFLPVLAGEPHLTVTGAKEKTVVNVHQSFAVPAHGQTTLHYQLYAGPKGYTQLSKYGKGLEAAVDFGTFSPLGKLILRAIYWLQRMTGNYGWAIVILTILLQLLLFPLTIKSFKATMAMKTLQPQIATLQKQYKGDPKRLNIEMMNLYKKSGTNPFGGCLPMLLQLPIFWALFTTLRNAYELRGAPWLGWIHDLSAADPFHVLPIVMGAAMFFQQRMSGASADPTQKQMMMMMPIMFTIMFFNFPAGLVLYWLTNNLLTMAIQWGMLRRGQAKPAFELVK